MKLIWILILLFIPLESHAADSDISAEIIKECKAPSQKKWDSGITSEMMDGSYQYNECLYNKITSLSENFFLKKNDQKDFLKSLKSNIENSYELNHLIYNGACSPCGTMFRGSHIGATNHILEDIIKRMILLKEYHNN